MLKRALDMVLATAALIVLAPLLVAVGVWIKADSTGPILYTQSRVGRGGRPFRILKFRTMRTGADRHGRLTIGDDRRITAAGHFLRRHKLDELPQLFNVLVGDMSLVGPRPEVEEYFVLYPDHARRAMLSLRPGITDYSSLALINEAEILGGSSDPIRTYVEELIPIKARHVIEYAERNTILGDLRILLLTVARLVMPSRRP